LIATATLRELLEIREREDADQVLLTATLDDPQGYGRIIRDRQGNAVDVVEEKDALPEQKAIHEINTGFACFKIASILEGLFLLSPANAAQEYYLTDLPRIFCSDGRKVITLATAHPDETRGINDLEQLALAERVLKERS
jgi:bifunctional UDP-N-acetylglucosamine pyrophosphorylase/glucosamine-1-phosphate N-acetyltransferase